MDKCILCGKNFIIGETGNELGFCVKCQKKKDFPYDLNYILYIKYIIYY